MTNNIFYGFFFNQDNSDSGLFHLQESFLILLFVIMDDSRWSKFRHQGDEYADQYMTRFMDVHSSQLTGEMAIFDRLTKNSDPSLLVPEFGEFFRTTAILPDWTDWDKINLAEKLFQKYGPFILMLLGCKSLPMAYTCGRGAEVLIRTGRLAEKNGSVDSLVRRLMETTQFVISVTSTDGFQPNGDAIIIAQKVRLMHSSIRYYLRKSGSWDTNYGIPINQQDMAGTLQSFSSLIVDGLEELGIELTDREKDAYVHLWRVVGHIMGVDPHLNPEGFKEAHSVGMAIFEDQRLASEAGKVLAKSLVEFMDYMLPGNAFDSIPLLFLWKFLGEENARILDLPEIHPNFMETSIYKFQVLFDKKFSHDSFYLETMKIVSKAMMIGMDHFYYHGKKAKLRIPPSLREDWRV
jgi:hypothetical protein